MDILIVDDHPIILHAIDTVLRPLKIVDEIFSLKKSDEVMPFLHDTSIDLVITDVEMKPINGIELSKQIRKAFPRIKILVHTQHAEVWVLKQLLAANVDGIVLKENDLDELIVAIGRISINQTHYSDQVNEIIINNIRKVPQKQHSSFYIELTKREFEVLQKIADEKTTQQIADELFLSPNTVETHRKNLFLKFGVHNSIGLLKKAIEQGLIELD